jgi:hypothetical protein
MFLFIIDLFAVQGDNSKKFMSNEKQISTLKMHFSEAK